ncbi:MAG TPA: alpha/beta hydrolase [Prolixibacteraceae bacterium]|nr:alpha/beta hydrolase [Prolixibacteraceae bacterium]
MRAIKIISGIIILLLATYFLGPQMPKPELNTELPVVSGDIGGYVTRLESAEKVRPDNEAKIIWANDSVHAQTEYVLLYLHGFSASRMEGFPVNEDFPKRYGCNAYLARLAAHGLITENPLIDMTPFRLYESAKLALVIAQQLGKKVIIMGTSTGGTLAIKLAADFPEMVYGLILYSPNVQIKQKTSVLLSKPWGLQIARLNFGGKFRVTDDDQSGEFCKYWYCRYRAEGPVFLQQLVDVTMTDEVFAKVKCPLFVGYYYKDEQHQDQSVEVKAALKMFDRAMTPVAMKRAQAFPEAGSHVIACNLTSKSVGEVEAGTYRFAEDILKMVPK